jgi:hypothetical protein
MQSVVSAIQEENKLRSEGAITDTSDLYGQLHQGRRTVIKLGGHYPAVVLDAKPDAEPPVLRCGVFLVPKVTQLHLSRNVGSNPWDLPP